MAYANVQDLQNRWRTLEPDELVTARTLLDDAATIIDTVASVDPEDELQAAAALIVSCNMVRRAMSAGASDSYGVSQMDWTMGPFGRTEHFSNPDGDMYLTSKELGWLGVTEGYILDMRPVIGGANG